MEHIQISKNTLITGLVLLIAGFVIMILGNDTYSFWKITIAPIVIVAAFVVIGCSVMCKKSNVHV
jgi:intracellular septation protein A